MDAPIVPLALTILLGVPAYAWLASGRRAYATWGFVILGVALPGALLLHDRLIGWTAPPLRTVLDLAFLYGLLAAGAHLAHLARARLRHGSFRVLVSIPGMVFLAVGALSGLWLLALLPVRAVPWLAGWDNGLAALRWLDLLPVGVGLVSVVTSLRTTDEVVRVPVADSGPDDRHASAGRALPPPVAGAAASNGRCASCRSPIRIWDRGDRCTGCGR